MYEESSAEFRTLQDSYWEMLNQFFITMVLVRKGDKQPDEVIKDNLEQARKVGERLHLADALYSAAELAWLSDRPDNMERYLREAEQLHSEMGQQANLNSFLRGWLAQSRNEFQQARRIFTTITQQMQIMGEKNVKSVAIVALGMLARDEQNLEQAQYHIKEALAIQQDIGVQDYIGESLTLLGQVRFFQGNLKDARQKFQEGLSILRQANNHFSKSNALLYFCNAYARLKPEPTMQILSILHDYFPINPLMKRESDSAIAQAREHLDEAAFHRAWAKGKKMTIEEAFDLALQTVEAM